MHTARYLAEQFEIEIDGAPATVAELLPGWGAYDRFGIVVHGPFATLGASLLVQAAVLAFYAHDPSRRDVAPQYPEIYLFHVGGRFGDHSWLDFWPPRKEVEVEARPDAVLAAVNDRAITRLAVPEGPPCDPSALVAGASSWADRQSGLARLRSCFVYAPTGEVADPDVVIRGAETTLAVDALATLDPEGTAQWFHATSVEELLEVAPGPSTLDDMAFWVGLVSARANEVPLEVRTRIANDLRARLHDGCAREGYRRLATEQALLRLAPADVRRPPASG